MTAVAPRPRVTTSADAEALVDAALDGDERAWSLLTELHRPGIRAVAMARLRDEHAADDVLQETLVRAWTRLHQLDDAHRLGAWLKTIAANVAVDHLRARRPVERLDVLDEPLGVVEPIEAHVVERDEARVLHGHLAGLREKDRVALWQRDALGAPIADVAGRLGMTDGSVRVLLTRARGKVRAGYTVVVAPLVGLGGRLRTRVAGLGEALPVAVVAPALVVAAAVGIVGPDWSAQAGAEPSAIAAPSLNNRMLVEAARVDGTQRADEVLVRGARAMPYVAGVQLVRSAEQAGQASSGDVAHVGDRQLGLRVSDTAPTESPDVRGDAPAPGPVAGLDVYVEDSVPAEDVLICTAITTSCGSPSTD